jgi:methyl-accepting chemotaxis protein
MKLLNNASITLKSLISALLGVVVLIGMAGLSITSFIELRSADEQQSAAVDLMSQARDAWIDLARGHAALYRAINLKSQNVEVALIRAAKNEATQSIDRARKTLASLKLAGLPVDAQLVTKAVKAIGDYAGAAAQAASFVEEDAFNATMFMTDADQKFGSARQDVSTLVATTIGLASAVDEQMTAMMHARLVSIAISAGVAVLLLVVVSTLLSRLISQPIKGMTEAMRRLAGGDLAVEIPAVDRQD